MKSLIIILSALVVLVSCSEKIDPKSSETYKKEIVAAETAFSQMAQERGLSEAFIQFADDSAVLMRNNNLIEGKESIKSYFEGQDLSNTTLVWRPDFVDVSTSGDLGYTYGSFTYSMTDTAGVVQTATGIFHTVWKRQEDGSWKYVWD